MSALPATNVRMFRIVAAAWLVGWFWKAWDYAGYYLDEVWSYPLHYAGLPRVLVHPALATVAWLAPVLVVGAIVVPRGWTLRAAAILMTLAAFIGCIHIETCADATFVTSFWVGVWLVWFTANAKRDDASLYMHARVLAQLTIGLVFAGGVIGKLTGAYASGEALFHLYFVQKPNWPYSALRESLDPQTLYVVAKWFSRVTIVIELVLAAMPLLPFRIAAIGAIVVMVGMVVVSTWYLLSVMACLIGLLVALRFSTPR